MVTFNFSFDPGTSLQQMIGFEVAGQIWSTYLRDNTTLNIHVGVSSSLPTGVIGGALPGLRAKEHYANVRNRLQADRTSIDDNTAFQNLQDEVDKYTAFIDGFKIDNNTQMNVTRANAKALGLLNDPTNFLDGYVLMSNLANQSITWNYDYSRTRTIASNQLDFLSTAIHEIGHLLGFVSGVDKPKWLSQKTQYNQNAIDDYYAKLTGTLENATVLDIFRHSFKSYTAGGAGESWMDLSVGGNPYFSIDGGKTALAFFSTGEATNLGGDGYQASHWKNQSSPIGIMNPTLNLGTRMNISAMDLRALDVIGWNLVSSGISTTINLSSLQTQARQRLASRIGRTVTWLDANSSQAAQQLSQNRDQDLSNMIDQSLVYNWGSEEGDPFWQRIQNLFFQQGLFAKLVPQITSSDNAIEIEWAPIPDASAGFSEFQALGANFLELATFQNYSAPRATVGISEPQGVTPFGDGNTVHFTLDSITPGGSPIRPTLQNAPSELGWANSTLSSLHLYEVKSLQKNQPSRSRELEQQSKRNSSFQEDWLTTEALEQM